MLARLYNLCHRRQGAGLLCVTTSRRTFLRLDDERDAPGIDHGQRLSAAVFWSAALLGDAAANSASFCMSALLVLADGLGSATQFNFRDFGPIDHQNHIPAQAIASQSRVFLPPSLP